MKIVGLVIGAMVAMFVLWMGFSYVWWQSNHKEVMQAVDQAVIEGREIGRDATDRECMTIYLEVMRDCKEMTCSIQNQVFLKSCLEHSERTELCASVPSKDELMTFAKWAANTCLTYQVDNNHCAAGLQEVAFYCEPQ